MLTDKPPLDLECPVCYSYFKKPILQCVSGHSICSTCRVKLNVCPLCHKQYAETRNYSLEGLINLIRIKCKHPTCQEASTLYDYAEHQTQCNFNVVPCTMPGCTWSGARMTIANHFKTSHQNAMVQIGKTLGSHHLGCCTIEYDSQLFCIKRKTIEGGIYYWTVQNLYNSNANYKAKITLTQVRSVYTLEQMCVKCSIDVDDMSKDEFIWVSKNKFKNYEVAVAISKVNKIADNEQINSQNDGTPSGC